MSEVNNWFGEELKVVMFDGSIKNIKDIKSGDVLIGPDSKPKRVLLTGVSEQDLIEFIPARNGYSFSLGLKNKLTLASTGKNCAAKYGEIVETSVSEFLAMRPNRQKYLTGYRSGCIHWEHVNNGEKLLLPSYYLGLWLGDGTAANTQITNMDPEVIDYIYSVSEKYNLVVRSISKGRAFMLYPSAGAPSEHCKGKNHLRNGLREMDLIKNKHIPNRYLFSSERDRLALLAGYLDTDGCLNDEYFRLTSELDTLAEKTSFLARSLGFAVNWRKSRPSKINGKIYNNLSIIGDIQRIPTKIARKKARNYKRKRTALKFGFKTKLLTSRHCHGIVLDGDGLFLASDFTVLKAYDTR